MKRRFIDAPTPMQRCEAEITLKDGSLAQCGRYRKRDEAEAENERLRALLRRGLRQLEAWQEKYGDWQPQWLPPAGDVRWAEDVSEALATPNVELTGAAPQAERPC